MQEHGAAERLHGRPSPAAQTQPGKSRPCQAVPSRAARACAEPASSPSPSPAVQRACAQPARGAAHGGGVRNGSANVRPGRWRVGKQAEWAGLEGVERNGRGRGKREMGWGGWEGGWERGIPEAGGGWAGWVPKELARAKDNAPECRECL